MHAVAIMECMKRTGSYVPLSRIEFGLGEIVSGRLESQLVGSRRLILVDHGTTRSRTFASPTHGPCPPTIGSFSGWWSDIVVVAHFQVKIDLFNDKLALLVLLTRRVRLLVRPAHIVRAALAKDITNAVQASNEQAVFGWPNRHIDTLIKEISTSMLSVKALGNDIVVTR